MTRLNEMNFNNRLFAPFIGIVIMLSAWTIVSCSDDDESFTDSPSQHIYFSEDTISFDTIFTDIGSATKELTIYNPNNKGVRLSSVRLGSNGSSGFRVNLDGQFNTQFNDVEIFHEDSIFCFIEVTVNPHDSDSPILITDSLLFTLSNGVTRKVLLQAYGQDIITMRDVTIKADTTLSPTRPIVIYDSLVVAASATLTIQPGSTLCFHKGAGLKVYGTLVCNGSLEQPIIMRGDRTDKLFPYLPYDRLDGQWEGITLYPESHNNVFNYCDIHSGNYGIIARNEKDKNLLTDYDEDELPKYTMTNCIVHNVVGDAIFLQRTKAQFFNSQISNAGNNCVTVVGGTTRFYHCTVAQFYPWNAEHGAALLFTNNMDNVVYPLHLIEFTNSIITGYADDELFGSRMEDSDATFNYRFVNSLINTVITDEESVNFPNCRFEPRLKDISEMKEEERPVNRATQFRLVDTDIYLYDFQLDTLSTARQLGDGTLVPEPCKYDLRGIPRPTDKPDAGCYQFVE
ncbi:MAG: hypothetical protein K6E52_01480 [Bacteroidaceae bacterium]|nr:hypothetical protein [Bacteroidaceae bacterium]